MNDVLTSLRKWEYETESLVLCFLEKYFTDENTRLQDIQWEWMPSEVGSMICVWGFDFFTLQMVLDVLRANLSKKELEEWTTLNNKLWGEAFDNNTEQELDIPVVSLYKFLYDKKQILDTKIISKKTNELHHHKRRTILPIKRSSKTL